MAKSTQNIRNVAVIAHVDHGKTTLVDALLKQTHVFRDNQKEMTEERILDSNEVERERGITILDKNCAIEYEGIKINIVDTPGHADFSGEVERTLSMVDGVLLIVDAQEGPMPQTRFVLKKALEAHLTPIVVINKIDKKHARIDYVKSKTENLFLELAQDESQLDFPILYAIGKDGRVFSEPPASLDDAADVKPLLDTIISTIPSPEDNNDKPFKMTIASLEYDEHLGKLAVGKAHQGKLATKDKITLSSAPTTSYKVEKLFVSKGLGKELVDDVITGDIIFIAGVKDIKIGDTICDPKDTTPLESIQIGEPTITITIGANTSPFSGREGEFTTGRQLGERLEKELEKNLSLKMKKLESGKFKVSGRGELHLAILLENLRREGYEFEVERPQVIIKEIDGEKHEPVEEVTILVPTEYVGTINQELGKRYAKLISMQPINDQETEFIYEAPTRAIIGLRSLLITLTKGTVIFSSQVTGFAPLGKPIPKIRSGALIASQSGDALSYGLQAAQERGVTFIHPGDKVYEGMIVGKNSKDEDIQVNVCKGKKLTNMRSTSSDGIIQLTPPLELTIDKCLDFIENDELVEITPDSLRLRKKHLSELERKRASRTRTDI